MVSFFDAPIVSSTDFTDTWTTAGQLPLPEDTPTVIATACADISRPRVYRIKMASTQEAGFSLSSNNVFTSIRLFAGPGGDYELLYSQDNDELYPSDILVSGYTFKKNTSYFLILGVGPTSTDSFLTLDMKAFRNVGSLTFQEVIDAQMTIEADRQQLAIDTGTPYTPFFTWNEERGVLELRVGGWWDAYGPTEWQWPNRQGYYWHIEFIDCCPSYEVSFQGGPYNYVSFKYDSNSQLRWESSVESGDSSNYSIEVPSISVPDPDESEYTFERYDTGAWYHRVWRYGNYLIFDYSSNGNDWTNVGFSAEIPNMSPKDWMGWTVNFPNAFTTDWYNMRGITVGPGDENYIQPPVTMPPEEDPDGPGDPGGSDEPSEPPTFAPCEARIGASPRSNPARLFGPNRKFSNRPC